MVERERGSAASRGYGARWRIARAAYLAQHPYCVGCKGQGLLIEATVEYEQNVMGHGKSVELFERMLEGFAWKQVADPFAGTGATIIACERHGRRCSATELQPSTAAVALERCFDAGMRPELRSPAESAIA